MAPVGTGRTPTPIRTCVWGARGMATSSVPDKGAHGFPIVAPTIPMLDCSRAQQYCLSGRLVPGGSGGRDMAAERVDVNQIDASRPARARNRLKRSSNEEY